MKDRVLALIDQRRDEIFDFLRQLIAMPGVTGEEGDVHAFIARKSGTAVPPINEGEHDRSQDK